MRLSLCSSIIFFLCWCALGIYIALSVHNEPLHTPLINQYDRSENYMTIKVMIYDDKESLYAAWLEDGGHALPDGNTLYGWSSVPLNKENDCIIHVTDIKYLEDRDTMSTWGHELAHCVKGSFHK